MRTIPGTIAYFAVRRAQYTQDPKRTPEHKLPKMATNPTNVTVDVGFVDLDLDLDLGSTSGSTIRSTSSEIFTDPCVNRMH